MWKKITVIYNSITNEGTIKKVWVLFYFPHNLRHNIYIYIYTYIFEFAIISCSYSNSYWICLKILQVQLLKINK